MEIIRMEITLRTTVTLKVASHKLSEMSQDTRRECRDAQHTTIEVPRDLSHYSYINGCSVFPEFVPVIFSLCMKSLH
jgi:hypothetical protein